MISWHAPSWGGAGPYQAGAVKGQYYGESRLRPLRRPPSIDRSSCWRPDGRRGDG